MAAHNVKLIYRPTLINQTLFDTMQFVCSKQCYGVSKPALRFIARLFMTLFPRLVLFLLMLLFGLSLPFGYEKIRKFENEQDEELCLHGTTCWHGLSFEEKLKIQKVWRHGGSLEEE